MAFCIETGRGVATIPATRENFLATMDNSWHRKNITDIRQNLRQAGQQEAQGNKTMAKKSRQKAAMIKSQLPGAVFQCTAFEEHRWVDKNNVDHGMGAWRNQEYCIINGLAMADFDHVGDPQPIIERWNREVNYQELGIKAVFITPSGEGLKVVFAARLEWGNLISNQMMMGELLGVAIDDSCKDASRLSFLPLKEDFVYLDNDLFDYDNEDYREKYNRQYNAGESQPDLFDGAKKPRPKKAAAAASATGGAAGENGAAPEKEKKLLSLEQILDKEYEDVKVRDFIAAYLPPEGVKEGRRHPTLLALASDLRYLLERNEDHVRTVCKSLPFVREIIDERGEKEVDKTISDAMDYRMYKRLPKSVNELLCKCKNIETDFSSDMELFGKWGERISQLFDVYPCLREVCANLRPAMYPAAVFTGASLFGTLMTRTWYHFFFDPEEERRLNYGIFIIGHPGTGKSFANGLYKTILEPVIAADKMGNEAVNNYKKSVKERNTSTKEQKKDALKVPVSKVRIHGARTSNNVFIDDMNACTDIVGDKLMHLHLFTFDAELDSIMYMAKGGQFIDKSMMELKAFHNEEDNQQYKNNDSYSGPFNVYWNYLYTGTPLALSRKVNERNFGSGLFGRLAVLPLNGDTYDIAPLVKPQKKGTSPRTTLREWAYKLDKTSGELPLWPLVETTWKWQKEELDLARIEHSDARAMLAKRVPYYGLHVSAPFVLMRHWEEWQKNKDFTPDDTDKAFCEFIMEMQCYCQHRFFGKYAEKYFDDQENLQNTMRESDSRQHTAFLRRLPDKFDLETVVKSLDITENYAAVLVHRWSKDGLINVLKSGRRNSKAKYEKSAPK